jgi:acyl-CoA thioester hydrolase
MSDKPVRSSRSEYRRFCPITTRWADNDVFAHVNNVTYYAYFDTAVNQYLIENGAFDIATSPAVGVVVETMCRFFRSVAFPDQLEIGLRVAKLGRSSIRYEIGVFKKGMAEIAAQGHFVHVYVKRESTEVMPVPDSVKHVVTPLLVDPVPAV